MREPWVLAVDLGNGGPKVAVVSLEGEVLRVAFRPVRARIGLDGAATQDAVEWWAGLRSAALEAISAAGADGGRLHVVAITGQYGSSVPVGADGEPVGEVLLWADTRARDLAREVIGGPLNIGGFAPHKVLPFVRITGGAPSPSGADPTGHALLLRERLREVYEKTRVILEPVDYLGLRFTGRAAATPASMLASWLTDNRIGAPFGYVDELLVRARREKSKLPELLPTGAVLGSLLPDVAEELGVAAGVPVVCGVPDLHAAVIGSGAIAPYDTHVAISTTAWISSRVPFKRTDILHQIATVPGIDAAHPIVVNNQETGGAALHWLREQIVAPNDGLMGGGSGIGAEGAAAEALAPSFDDLIRLAARAPAGCEGLLFTPWLNGERSPAEDKVVRAGWLNLSLRSDRAMLVRSVLEGVAYNARWLFDAYEKFLRRPVPKVRILGGGAQSELWCQIYADVFGRPVEQVADPRNAQLRGVALWARICLGELTLDDVPGLVPVPESFVPTDDAVVYARGYAEYRKLFGRLKGLYHRLNSGGGPTRGTPAGTAPRGYALSLASVRASIWRMRSRVTPNTWPTSSSVRGRPSSRPKRRRSTVRSRRESRPSTAMISSCRTISATSSTGAADLVSSTKSPSWESPSSPTCWWRLAGSWLILWISRILATVTPISAAISSGTGSRPISWMSSRCTRTYVWMFSTMWTGTRMVRDWSARARVMAWRIHQVA